MKRKSRQPWERLPKESDPAWEAFVRYRDMPEETGLHRSITRLEQNLNKSRACLGNWSSKYNWVERCKAYDQYMDDIKISERVKAKKKQIQEEEKMDSRHVGMATQIQKLMFDVIKEADTQPLTPKEIAELTKALSTAVNIERTSRHVTNADKQLILNREIFEHKKEQDNKQQELDTDRSTLADDIMKAWEERIEGQNDERNK